MNLRKDQLHDNVSNIFQPHFANFAWGDVLAHHSRVAAQIGVSPFLGADQMFTLFNHFNQIKVCKSLYNF